MASLFVRATRIFCTFPDFTGNARSNLYVDEYLTAMKPLLISGCTSKLYENGYGSASFRIFRYPVVNNGFESGVSRNSARFFPYIPSLGLYFLLSPRLANAASAARDISANWP